jgi:4-hydroxy-tetrahydrodipicolinate reductase
MQPKVPSTAGPVRVSAAPSVIRRCRGCWSWAPGCSRTGPNDGRLPRRIGGWRAAFQYVGTVAGTPRVELHLEWQMPPHTDPQWDIKGCYITKIQGDPCIYSKHMILPKPGTDFSSAQAFAAIGMTVTGMPALNAIRAVVDAAPGVITSADLPLRAFAGRFATR